MKLGDWLLFLGKNLYVSIIRNNSSIGIFSVKDILNNKQDILNLPIVSNSVKIHKGKASIINSYSTANIKNEPYLYDADILYLVVELDKVTVKDLIIKKDYDYISWRVTLPDEYGGGDTFFGTSRSKNGKLISLDGDIYDENTEIIKYEEWSAPEDGIMNGLTIVYKSEWRYLEDDIIRKKKHKNTI